MSFTCAKCGVALDLTPGSVPLLGEDENQKRTRWIQQAGQHFSAVHPEVMGTAFMLQGAVGLVFILSTVRTDDALVIAKFAADQLEIVRAIKQLPSPKATQEVTVQ